MSLGSAIGNNINRNIPYIGCLLGFALINWAGVVELNSGIIIGLMVLNLQLRPIILDCAGVYNCKLEIDILFERVANVYNTEDHRLRLLSEAEVVENINSLKIYDGQESPSVIDLKNFSGFYDPRPEPDSIPILKNINLCVYRG